jgi:hypothetical protein
MQVVLRCLLALALPAWVTSCSLNNHGLGNGDAGRPGFDSGAVNPQGIAGVSGSAAAGSTAGTTAAPMGTGGTNLMPTAGTTGGASVGSAGTGGSAGDGPTSGGAGTGAAGTGAAGSGSAGSSAAGGAAGTNAGGANGAAGTIGAGGSTAGGNIPGAPGCSDDTREGFLDRIKYPKIAACSGGWEDPGLLSPDSHVPKCDRRGGNDGDRSDGRGCSVTDLCAAGWSVCESAQTLSAIPGGCTDAVAPFGDSPVFFLTRQRATGLVCDNSPQAGSNNLYGCGNIGSIPDKSCAPLTRVLRDSDCRNQSPWSCASGPIGTSQNEFQVVTKDGPNRGGVLCCKD